MKRIIYNNYVKFAAFMLCALSAAFASYLFTTNFLKEDNIYLFEGSYENSFAARNAVSKEFDWISRRLRQTIDKDGRLHPEKLPVMPSPDEWEYYVKTSGGTYTNVENGSYDAFEREAFSMGIKNVRGADGEFAEEAFSNTGGGDHYFLSGLNEEYEICVKMPQSAINQNRNDWQSMKYGADRAAVLIIALLIFAAALFVYLLCATGRVCGKEEIQLMLVDRMFVEITLALLLTILIGGGTLTVLGAVYFLAEESFPIANPLIAAAVFAVVSLSMLLALSLARNLKNGTFLKRSLICRICAFLRRTVKRIFARLRRVLSEVKRSVLTVSAKSFDGRFVGIMIIAYSAAIAVLAAITINAPAFVIFLIALTLGAAAFVSKRLIGFANLKSGIEKIKNGELEYKITDCPDGVIGRMAENINSIGEGLQTSLERGVKAERMKSELITNVSHDLKTPLTSIINYADLLSKETLAPTEANDYAAIIKQKSERLKQLTNDLFDISRVQSGNEEFNIEDIDICLLINQAMAELDERIKASGLDFRVKADNKAVFVKGDGKKLSRVFENLLINCVKYAMKNTRVYIDIAETDKGASVEIKNIAGYEMNFDESEITERFVRGDSARSTDGSGLGLAIVKSYTEGCGGSVEIKTDGDLFKVVLRYGK